MWKLSVECHDWPECLIFRNQSQLCRCEVVARTLTSHFVFLDRLEILFKQIFSAQSHDQVPDVLSVVKDSRVFFLLLGGIKIASQKRDDELLEDPLQ